ncbi:FAD-dependent oxidoreductase [Streptosporangium sp. NPDC051023]|uniref:FAD-dependent oxidoreductase n=1 Tax=Streptosporangium sp. NPDC051023 TaxID=3155410 RepID=UPI00344C240D
MSGDDTEETQCVIAGGGPAGAMLGWLLARAGVRVVVLEKHGDFRRDFRGDTVHSSTMQIMDDLGVGEEFLAIPHQRESSVLAVTDDGEMSLADFSSLRIKYPFIAYMPQWDLLDFVASQARRYPGFRMELNARATGLIEENGRIAGVRYVKDGRERELRASLTVAADGRHSVLRRDADLPVRAFGTPMDLLWFRLTRKDSDPARTFARLSRGSMVAMIHRGDYWQAAYVIPKGTAREWSDAAGLGQFRQRLEELIPWLDGRTGEIVSWDDVHELDVRLDRAERWHRDGFLAIGDAAHAMSVVGGVGINLAVQDAVAAARILAPALLRGRVSERLLAKVQKRRSLPTTLTQRLQRTIQDRFLTSLLAGETAGRPPAFLRALFSFGPLQRAKARIVAVGFRPERATGLIVAGGARGTGGAGGAGGEGDGG